MDATQERYEEHVYAAVLGKVIGVYAGRPFEGWPRAEIEKRWGAVDRYVHEDRGVDLVVPDDDISGTLAFVRGLEDSGLFEKTPEDFFGDTWLNYLLEGRTVLWWGGMGHSTEHTAYLRLKHGVRAPRSGSVALNGRTVAEQIGAQIFIDAFGMVAPGRPELAAELARKAASVSHDGEAVNAAVVVAAMVSAAFVERDMDRLLDVGIAQVDAGSLIAKLHRDIRAWTRADGDWRRTFARIEAEYGYDRYGGNCHVVPNHAILVLSWCAAPNDFHRALTIACTAGWDTDCNAANVACLMGLKVGLAGINAAYDWQGPFADRIILPTAEGTRGITDALIEALHVARIGRRVMRWPALPAPKDGAWHHFSLPGALHGWMTDASGFESRGAARARNVSGPAGRRMEVRFETGGPRAARVCTPISPPDRGPGGYAVSATPRLYPGMTVRCVTAAGPVTGQPAVRLFARAAAPSGKGAVVYGDAVPLIADRQASLILEVPDFQGWPVEELGLEVTSALRAEGTLFVESVSLEGTPRVSWPALLPRRGGEFPGWVWHGDIARGPFSDDREEQTRFGKNEGRGVLVTGTTDWSDYAFEARVGVHLADAAGILVRWQGMERYVALVKTPSALRLVRRLYGETVLAEHPCAWEVDELHHLRLECRGQNVSAFLDGTRVMSAQDRELGRGGAGFVVESGLMGLRDVRVS